MLKILKGVFQGDNLDKPQVVEQIDVAENFVNIIEYKDE